MPGSGKKKKKGSGSQALGAEETGSAKESEKTSFGDDVDDLTSPKGFLNDRIVDFQQKYPGTFREITTMFSDEASIMFMISAYENYEDKVEFDDLLSLNVDNFFLLLSEQWLHMVASPRKLSKESIVPYLWSTNLAIRRMQALILKRFSL